MKLRRALLGFGGLTLGYVAALAWADGRTHAYDGLGRLAGVMPALMAVALLSYGIRYARWHWLLRRAGCATAPGLGFLAYLAGFAFTATPGKVGELVRMRYLQPQGVAPARVLAAFVFERAFDLLAVLLLSSLFVGRPDVLLFVLAFVLLFVGALVVLGLRPALLTRLAAHARLRRAGRVGRGLRVLRDGLAGCRLWLTPLDVAIAFGLALLAWGVTALSFVAVLQHLAVALHWRPALGIYPLSMLAGAASMLPGGVGSTEATMVALLSLHGVAAGTATLAAVAIRLSTLWFAVLCGMAAVGWLELTRPRR